MADVIYGKTGVWSSDDFQGAETKAQQLAQIRQRKQEVLSTINQQGFCPNLTKELRQLEAHESILS